MNVQTFDFSVDLLRAVLWQYNDATRLQALLTQKQAWYDENQETFWTNWVTDVFDLRTANDFGLAVWAIILGVPLTAASAGDAADKPLWGFGANHEVFGHGNFASSQSSGLTTEQRRLVLRLRYFQLTTRGTVPEANTFLKALFPDLWPLFVEDNLDMSVNYVFGAPLSSDLQTVLQKFDLLPRPAGVGATYTYLDDLVLTESVLILS